MEDDHDEALEAFLAAMDKRLKAAPLIERREQDRRARPDDKPVDGRRVHGPVDGRFRLLGIRPSPKS